MSKTKLLGYAYPPLNGELRSSWLRRLAYSNDGNFASFCHRLYRHKRLTQLDIDCLDEPALEEILTLRTVATREQIKQTSLLSLQGNLAGTIRTGGRGRFILPSNPILSYPDNPGIQWCPICLDEETAYWRKSWRLSFVTICTKHKCRLADLCPDCGACAQPILRGDLRCWRCGYDLRRHPLQASDPSLINFQKKMLNHLTEDERTPNSIDLPFIEAHHVLTFRVLWLLMRLVSGGPRSKRIRSSIKQHYNSAHLGQVDITDQWRVETFGVNSRHSIMMNVNMLVNKWPDSFVTICKSANLTWSDFLRGNDERDLPFKYREVLIENFAPQTFSRSPTFSARYA